MGSDAAVLKALLFPPLGPRIERRWRLSGFRKRHIMWQELPWSAGMIFSLLIFWPHSVWNLSSLTRDRPMHPDLEAWSHDHWTAREILEKIFSEGPYPGEEAPVE